MFSIEFADSVDLFLSMGPKIGFRKNKNSAAALFFFFFFFSFFSFFSLGIWKLIYRWTSCGSSETKPRSAENDPLFIMVA